MLAIRSRILLLVLCFIEAIFLLFAQVFGSTLFLLPCLLCFLLLAAWSAVKSISIPVLLFFLPFAPLLKLEPGSISFYTIALVAVYLIYIVMGSKSINIYHIIPAMALIALIAAVKIIYGYTFDNSFFLFSLSLMMVPFLVRELDHELDFYWLTIFFALGIVLAAVTSQYLLVFPTITRYINVLSHSGIIRYAGYYGDPNFYSAHITAALSGALIMLLGRVSKKRAVVMIFLIAALLYCGFMSVSKSFFLVSLTLLVFWIIAFSFKRERVSLKVMIILTFSIGVIFLLSTTVFSGMVDMMFSRFGNDTNLSDFTTGRTDIWMQYINTLGEDPLLLLFGKGFTSATVNGRAAHNTVIQAFFQFGIIGAILLLGWFICYVRTLLGKIRIKFSDFTPIFILLIGAFGPWMGLDMIFFDEFFLIPIYVCFGIRFIIQNTQQAEIPSYRKY